MRYLSVCSGLEAASVAWRPLGWRCVGVAEIDPFACAVLAHHYPTIPNFGNLEHYRDWPLKQGDIDLLVGGTPCQAFSVAGLRRGLDDPRGNLALTYLGLVEHLRPRWVVWENVPGVLSSSGGRDFGAFLGGLAQLGYGFAYRVLDAQYVRVDSHPGAVPQRRRRVFVVGCAGGKWRCAARVLLEPEGVRGDPPTRRQTRQATTDSLADGVDDGRQRGVAVAHSLTASTGATEDGTGRRTPLCVDVNSSTATPSLLGFSYKDDGADARENVAPTMRALAHDKSHANGGSHLAVAFDWPVDTIVPDVAVTSRPSVVQVPVVTVPIDLRQTARGENNTNNRHNSSGGSPGTGIGTDGDPAFTVSARGQAVALTTGAFIPTVAFHSNMGGNDGGVYTNGSSPTMTTERKPTTVLAWQPRIARNGRGQLEPVCPALNGASSGTTSDSRPALLITGQRGHDGHGVAPTLKTKGTNNDFAPMLLRDTAVRRLTPRECERLQGFPDDYTLISYRGSSASDSPRYKALGNSMAVNVMRWIGERLRRFP